MIPEPEHEPEHEEGNQLLTRKKTNNKKKQNRESPTSSPLKWDDIVEISCDSELERSMVEMEAAISLEFSDSD